MAATVLTKGSRGLQKEFLYELWKYEVIRTADVPGKGRLYAVLLERRRRITLYLRDVHCRPEYPSVRLSRLDFVFGRYDDCYEQIIPTLTVLLYILFFMHQYQHNKLR